ncbi:MAG: YgiT-type zinc finger protein [Anaerolineales bacterium]
MNEETLGKYELPVFPCNECQAGMMRLSYITYFTWLDEELVTVPGFPAWICDVCGKREYDDRAVNWLTTLLSPNAGQTTIRSKPRRRVLGGKRQPNRPSSSE